MERRTVQLRLAGQTYRVVTTASDDELKHLLGVVEEKLGEVTPAGRPPTPNAMLLVALSLVHELEAERERAQAVEGRSRELLQKMLERIDVALEEDEEAHAPPPLVPVP